MFVSRCWVDQLCLLVLKEWPYVKSWGLEKQSLLVISSWCSRCVPHVGCAPFILWCCSWVHWWVEYAPGVKVTLERCLSGPGLPTGCGKLGATLRGGGHLSWWRPPTHCRAAVANLWGASLALGVVLVGQLYPTLCDPTDYSLPSSSLCPWHSPSKEWVAIPFFRRSSQSRG